MAAAAEGTREPGPRKSWFITCISEDGDKVMAVWGKFRESARKHGTEESDGFFTGGIGQLEQAPTTATRHVHMLVHTARATRPSALKRYFNCSFLNCQPPRSGEAVETYVTKPESRIDGPVEFGTLSHKAAARLSAGTIVDLVRRKTHRELLAEYPDMYEKRMRFIDRVTDLLPAPSRPWVEVIVHYGQTGLGKTYDIFGAIPRIYRVYQFDKHRELWDGYDGENDVLIDDFDSANAPPLARLLQVLDPYPLTLPARYHGNPARFTRVWMTSQEAPGLWYLAEQAERRDALQRRLSFVRHYFRTPAGETRKDIEKDQLPSMAAGAALVEEMVGSLPSSDPAP